MSARGRYICVDTIPRQAEPLRTYNVAGVRVEVFEEGDQDPPQRYVEVHLVGRLPSGCVFEGTRAKGRPPMRVEFGKNEVITGMELGLKSLSLGALAELHIPAELGYREFGVPRMVPPSSDIIFEVEILVVDGRTKSPKEPLAAVAPLLVPKPSADDVLLFNHPWWLARVDRPPPPVHYLNVCRHLAREGVPPDVLDGALPLPRTTGREAAGWNGSGTGVIASDVIDNWRARKEWSWDWIKQHLGDQRQLVKWIGPVFTAQESQWENPLWETSVGEYVDYILALERVDPYCEEQNAGKCPRLYLNGWPAFQQLPWLREYVINPDWVDDVTWPVLSEHEALREALVVAFTQKGKGVSAPIEERQKGVQDEYWDLTKLFISPRGAITRLHFDNGVSHAWLTQVIGRKLFVCYAPSDSPNLHPFGGDEGQNNGTWLDPLDPEVLEKWPDHGKATPYIGIVEEGEMILVPTGWWHYAVSLEPSVTVMRNFYSKENQHELVERKDERVRAAVVDSVFKNQPKLRGQPDEKLHAMANKLIKSIRKTMRGESRDEND